MLDKLLEKDIVFLDGAMGTMVFDSGVEVPKHVEELNVTAPEVIKGIHKQYIDAGSDIIYSFTFSANRYKYSDSEYDVVDLIKRGVANAKEVAKDKLVALDIGPIGTLLEPSGTLKFEEAYEIFKEVIVAGNGADLVVFETMSDLYELKAGILAAKENSDLPIMASMTFEQNGRSFTGTSVRAFVTTAESLGVDIIGVNCSLGPIELKGIVREICDLTNLPVMVKANAGLPNPQTDEYDLDVATFLGAYQDFMRYGVKVVGGCCGTTPEYIKALHENLISHPKDIVGYKSTISSGTDALEIDGVKVIGERINPTGKKRFKQALLDEDIDYILSLAIEQVDAGASILDVNVGTLNIDEPEMMTKVVKAIQSVVDVPLQIDSSDLKAIEAGLRVYNGKPIVNSVNGEKEKLETILPLVKKYGASVVGLTIDENGIPSTSEKRIQIAKDILNAALSYGIKKEDVYIDALTLTVASSQDQAQETLKAMNYISNVMGLQLVLGVSNISFGLPNRPLMNQTFLTVAMTNGLTLPIINPNSKLLMDSVNAYQVISGKDIDSNHYIEKYKNEVDQPVVKTGESMDIFAAVNKGLENEVHKVVAELLKTKEPLEIVNEYLIPALDAVGNNYESGKIFLPQLIKSASSASAGFELIKQQLSQKDEVINRGTIVLATVKGDVHDIGKNIVKVILENYGFKVIDLGKDVAIEEVVEAVKKHEIKLVGLSALMTTTVKNMEETIKALRENELDCQIIVGGAVLTPEHSKVIGADFYARDAKDAVDIANEVFGYVS